MPSAEIPTYLVRPESELPCDTVIFVAPCAICGRRHVHGLDDDLRNGAPSHRVANCPDPKSRPRRFRHTGSHERGYLIHLQPENENARA